jgi:hypothetical protein
MTSPFINGSWAASKCCASALNAAPRQTDTPTPVNSRPSIIMAMLCAAPNTQIPAAANNSVPAVTRREPKWSSSTPAGSCAPAKPRK